MIDVRSNIFLFNVAREQMQFLQYSVLEMMKDRMISSPKYESQMKILHDTPHVIVFSNEQPDYAKMSADRFKVTNL